MDDTAVTAGLERGQRGPVEGPWELVTSQLIIVFDCWLLHFASVVTLELRKESKVAKCNYQQSNKQTTQRLEMLAEKGQTAPNPIGPSDGFPDSSRGGSMVSSGEGQRGPSEWPGSETAAKPPP